MFSGGLTPKRSEDHVGYKVDGNASPEPFPGAVCQLVGATQTAPRPPARTRVLGRNADHDAEGVHAPD